MCIPRRLSIIYCGMASEPASDADLSLSAGTSANTSPPCVSGFSTSSVCVAACSLELPPVEDSVEGELVSLDSGISVFLLFSAVG
jgi:hypothetical protein